jgi:2'-hydroxyisoflavone reductase
LLELDDPTVEEVTSETSAVERFGPGTVIVRPTYVVGPDDYTWRFPWWVQRLACGGEVLAPGPADAPAQVIDARDMATWTVGLLEHGQSGAFHAVSPAPLFSFGDQLEAIRATVAPEATNLTWVDEDFLLAEGLDDGSLPLWSGGDPGALIMAADPSAAFATGLRPRPLPDTVRDTLEWLRGQEQPTTPGLSPDREVELLRRWHAR